MANKTTTGGTFLYPGVILRGNNILINTGPTVPKTKTKWQPKAPRKANPKSDAKKRNKRFVNILIDE